MKKLAAAVLAFSPMLASAVTTSVDYTDVWWIPAESGWGANMVQQGDTMLVTLFVYDSAGKPTWYVGPSTTATGATHFSGLLYSVTGPYFGATHFDPATEVVTQVGTIAFDATSSSTGTLTYSVNGVNVTKSVQRETWRTEDMSGSYRGGTVGNFTNCDGNGGTSPVDEAVGITIQQTGTAIIMNEFGPGYTCRYTGTLVQAGKLASITGSGTCSDGSHQSFSATNIQTGPDFVSMHLDTAVNAVCKFSGRFGGVRQN